MVYRYSWLAGLGGLLFAFVGLNGLLQSTVEGPPWQFVVIAGVALGVIITWTVLSYRLNEWIVVGLNLVAMLVAVGRIAAPDTTAFILPTASTFTELRVQFDQAFDIIRHGHEPVIPVSGIVVILMLLFWAVGALLAWGLTTGHPYVAVLPPLVMSLQFATMDRNPTGWLRVTVFMLLVAGTILAITTDERDQTAGRMARRGEWPSTRSRLAPAATALLAVTLVTSLASVTALQNRVPYDGVLDWRSPSGLTGGFFGSVSYNPFISIRQQLVTNSTEPVFYAQITGDVPADEVYFQLLTMETYAGGQFFADRPEVFRLDDGDWVDGDQAFAGPTAEVTTDIIIDRLRMDWLPTAYAATAVEEATTSVERSLRVRHDDAALLLDGGLSFRGMEYSVRSEIPSPDVDVLAVTETGALSASFALAFESDEVVPQPPTAAELEALIRPAPPGVQRYLDLPRDDPSARIDEIQDLAELRTRNLTSDFEKALQLEAWFHSPKTGDGSPLDGFGYTTVIEPGHGATDLAAWLLDPSSPNYRAGYCENFATAMAIMARTLGIPSRVVLGFTPGEPARDIAGDNVVVVRDRNAHAWVELWMPAQGWVRFDPTPRTLRDTPQTFETVQSQLQFDLTSYLDIPDQQVASLPTPPGGGPLIPSEFEERFIGTGPAATTSDGGFSVPGWVTVTLPIALLLVLGFGAIPAVKWVRRRRRMRRLAEGDVTAAWEEIVERLSDLGAGPDPGLTPDEYAAGVDRAMAPLASVYGRALYGPADAIEDHHVTAAQRSLNSTTHRLVMRYSKGQRFVASYRPATVLPRWMRRSRNGR